MRFTPEQRAQLQTKMIDAHEAKQAAWLEQQVNTRLEDLRQSNLARHAMINDWTDKVSPELLQLVVTEEWIVDYEYSSALIDQCLDESLPTPLVLEYEGEMLEIREGQNGNYPIYRLESKHWVSETSAEAEQYIWSYFGQRLAEQEKAEARHKREAEERCNFDAAIAPIINAVTLELLRASRKHGRIRNQHELYAVLLEELQEFWEEVRKAQVSAELSPEAIKELIQIAAMGLRGLLDLGAFK